MITLASTVHEIQEFMIPRISLKKANKICAKYSTTISEMMLVFSAVSNVIENGLVTVDASIEELHPFVEKLLFDNGVELNASFMLCGMAMKEINLAEEAARTKKLKKQKSKCKGV